MNVKRPMPIICLCVFLCVASAWGDSVDKAKMLYQHGLVSEAKKELIEVIFSKQNAKNKAEAYYFLGTVAFEEGNISAALETWTQLIKYFPESNQAKLVTDKIAQLSEIVGETSRTTVENAIAKSYFRNADFWSKGKSDIFKIDGSWIPFIEAAMYWYDKTIQEFPKTKASRLAYEDKMRTLIGWKEPGRYGQSYGLEWNFDLYMGHLLNTFSDFERDHPQASSLQAFRYQIAQAFWKQKRWDNVTHWLNQIVEHSREDTTFYRDLAERRLKNLKY